MMIPAGAISIPPSRALHMLAGPHGLFDSEEDPFAATRAPFRITASTLKPPGIDEALAVLAGLAPVGAIWLAWPLLRFGETSGVWRVNASFTTLSPSRRVFDDPLYRTTTPSWYAVSGLPRLPDGMYVIDSGHRTLLAH
jgi:hypothetical protein